MKEKRTREEYRKYLRHFQDCTGTILDIGCGRGEFLELLRENNMQAIGIDINEKMVNLCRSKGLEVYEEDALSLLKRNQKFGGIFCGHLIEHLEIDKVSEFLNSCFTSLVPGGTLVIITPNPQNLYVITEGFWNDISHKRPYPLTLLQKLLIKAGFTIVDMGEDIDTIKYKGFRAIMCKLIQILLACNVFSGTVIYTVCKKTKIQRGSITGKIN